jgi:hypothetical protein
MTKREIASLVIKLMGVFILIRSLLYMPMTFGNVFTVGWQDRGEWIGTLFLLGFLSVLPPVFSLAIIILSDKLAEWLIKDDHPIELPGSVRKEDVMLVVFTCVGLYLIVTAIPTLIVYLSNFLMFHRARNGVSYSGGFYNAYRLVAPVVQIALGVWLFVGSSGLVKLWKKIRS